MQKAGTTEGRDEQRLPGRMLFIAQIDLLGMRRAVAVAQSGCRRACHPGELGAEWAGCTARDGTRAVEGVSGVTRDATLFLHNGTQAIAAILVLAERLDATLTRVDAVLTSLEETNAALQPTV